MDREAKACIAMLVTTLIIISCALLGSSFDTIKPTQVGIYFDDTDQKMDFSKVYRNGRHCLAPGHSFKVKYKTKLLYFDLGDDGLFNCWTKDKQSISLELGVYYRIRAKGVTNLYRRHGNQHKRVWKAMMSEAIRGSTRNFDTTDFFTARPMVRNNITASVKNRLKNEQIENITVLINNVYIPTDFESAVTEKVVSQQEEITTLFERNLTLVLAETELIQANADMQVSIIESRASAKAARIVSEASAEVEKIEEEAYADAYRHVQFNLGLTDDQLMKYIWARNLKDQPATSKLVVGFKGGSIDVTS